MTTKEILDALAECREMRQRPSAELWNKAMSRLGRLGRLEDPRPEHELSEAMLAALPDHPRND